MSRRGSDTAEFTCDLCGDHFDTKRELRDHVSKSHELNGDIPP